MTAFALLQLGYQIALAALTTGILLKGTGPMRRTICTVFAVMMAAWLLAPYWPSVFYSLAMISIDALACLVITWHPAGRWQSVVGLSYILQIGVHIGRIFNGENADITSFWWGLSLLAVLQMILVGGWWLHDCLGLRLRWSGAYPVLGRSRHSGLV